jgi:four helix bundle protein
MVIKSFEDVLAWQKAKTLTIELYSKFKHSRDFAFKDQIQRASVSIMNNVAEGFERATNKELKYFLFISKGSCGEVRSMLLLANDLGYISSAETSNLTDRAVEISRMLSGFIKTL